MTAVMKKRILISPEQKNAQLGAFFQELGIELNTEFDKNHTADYLFVIDDYLSDLKNLPRLQTKESLLSTCLSEVRAFIDITQLEVSSVKKLMGSYFADDQGFDLVDHYSKDFKNIYSLKIHDYLNVGYFIDKIVVEAYKNKFDFEEIRNYLNSALPFALKQVEVGQTYPPLDVSFSYSEEGFAIEIALSAPAFDTKKDFDFQGSCIAEFFKKTNCFDACYFTKRERLILSSSWFKDEKLKNFKSYFFSEISRRHDEDNGSSLINVLDENQGDTQYAVQPVTKDHQSSTIVKGNPEVHHLAEFQRILGQKTPEDLAVIRLSGSADDGSDEEWKVKNLGLAQKIQEEIVKIKALDQTVDEDDLVRIISSEPDVNLKEASTLVKGIMEEVTGNLQIQKIPDDPGKIKLENQIVRMKKIMEQMKAEMIRLRAMTVDNVISTDSIIVEHQTTTSETTGNEEKLSTKQKNDFEKIYEAKDKKIQILEARIEELKEEFSRSQVFANEEKLAALESENKSLSMRLDFANRKINIINENMEKQDTGVNAKKDKEISTLKSHIQMAQAMMEKFKQERNDLEKKLVEERDKVSKIRDEKATAVGSPRDQSDKDKQIITIATDKKNLEEKFRAQGIELKKIEQRLKFATAQLEESLKKKNTQSSQGGGKTNDTHLKQLENANARIAETCTELVEKKKEILKFKQDNTVLSAKVAELEKKLGNIDKKAA